MDEAGLYWGPFVWALGQDELVTIWRKTALSRHNSQYKGPGEKQA